MVVKIFLANWMPRDFNKLLISKLRAMINLNINGTFDGGS